MGKGSDHRTNACADLAREGVFDPLACTLEELEEEIKRTRGQRSAFLQGIRHTRVIYRAAGVVS